MYRSSHLAVPELRPRTFGPSLLENASRFLKLHALRERRSLKFM